MKNKKTSRAAQNYDVLPPYDYLSDFLGEAMKSRKRIWLQTMYFNKGNIASEIESVLKLKSKSNIDIKMNIDWFHIMKQTSLPILSTLWRRIFSKNTTVFTEDMEHIKRLIRAKVNVSFTNRPSTLERILIYKGRNHMKITIVDDIAYVGGLNIADGDFEKIDFMIKLKNKKLVKILSDQFLASANNTLIDKIIKINSETMLLIDSGKTKKSKILSFATKHIQVAKKSIQFVNQFVPDGELLDSLYKVYKKGIGVEVFVPRNNKFSIVFYLINYINISLIRIKRKDIPLTKCSKQIHAKLLLIDKNRVFFGSHNLSVKGIKMKTAELAIYSTNVKLVRNLSEYYSVIKLNL